MTELIPQPQSPFLRLPGELRNLIYEYLTVQNRNPKYTLHKAPGRFQNGSQYKNPKREGHGLIHTCRQIRHEFQPLEGKKNYVRLDLLDMNEYISDFVRDPARTTENYFLNVPSVCPNLSLLPLIRLKYASMCIDVRIHQYYPADGKDVEYQRLALLVEGILALDRIKPWRDYLRDAVTNITVTRPRKSLSWSIEVNKAAKQEWMPWDVAAPWENLPAKHRAAATIWRMKLGMGASIIMPNIVVASD